MKGHFNLKRKTIIFAPSILVIFLFVLGIWMLISMSSIDILVSGICMLTLGIFTIILIFLLLPTICYKMEISGSKIILRYILQKKVILDFDNIEEVTFSFSCITLDGTIFLHMKNGDYFVVSGLVNCKEIYYCIRSEVPFSSMSLKQKEEEHNFAKKNRNKWIIMLLIPTIIFLCMFALTVILTEGKEVDLFTYRDWKIFIAFAVVTLISLATILVSCAMLLRKLGIARLLKNEFIYASIIKTPTNISFCNAYVNIDKMCRLFVQEINKSGNYYPCIIQTFWYKKGKCYYTQGQTILRSYNEIEGHEYEDVSDLIDKIIVNY